MVEADLHGREWVVEEHVALVVEEQTALWVQAPETLVGDMATEAPLVSGKRLPLSVAFVVVPSSPLEPALYSFPSFV